MTARRNRGINAAKIAQLAVDVCLAFVLVFVQATALADEIPHEWLGISAFVLVIIHVIFGRKRIIALSKGRSSAENTVQLLVDTLLAITILGQIASSVILSEHAFSWLPVIPGAFWARMAHLLCGYWSFVLAFIHVGLHLSHLPKAIGNKPLAVWVARIAIVATTAAGTFLFISMEIPSYLFLQSQFPFVDFSTPLWMRFLQWTCIGIALSAIAASTKLLARKAKN